MNEMKMKNELKIFQYLNDLNSEGVIIRVAPVVKGKSKGLLPVDRDTVEVLISQCQPHLTKTKTLPHAQN